MLWTLSPKKIETLNTMLAAYYQQGALLNLSICRKFNRLTLPPSVSFGFVLCYGTFFRDTMIHWYIVKRITSHFFIICSTNRWQTVLLTWGLSKQVKFRVLYYLLLWAKKCKIEAKRSYLHLIQTHNNIILCFIYSIFLIYGQH